MPRLRAKGIEADATINKLSTIIQPTLANSIARAEGNEKTPSELGVDRGFEERERKESAIRFNYTNEVNDDVEVTSSFYHLNDIIYKGNKIFITHNYEEK